MCTQKNNKVTKSTLEAGFSSHLVGLVLVKLVQGAPNGPLTGVHHEFTHLPAPYGGVQVHVIHPAADFANLIFGQFVDDKPSVKILIFINIRRLHTLTTFTVKTHTQKKPQTHTHTKQIKSTHQSTGSPASFRQEMSALWHTAQQKKMTAISRRDLKPKPIVNASSCKMKMALSRKGKLCIFSVLSNRK